MENSLQIRPRPIEGEGLTSYLLRASKKNEVGFLDIWRLSKTTQYKIVQFKLANQIDVTPEKVFNLTILSNLLGIAVVDLKRMTFSYAAEKFSQSGRTFRRLLELRIRRICPICSLEGKGYKLLWQVREIEICDVHHVTLQTRCPKCGVEQPYIRDECTATFTCYKCGTHLSEDKQYNIVTDHTFITEQLRRYRDWAFLVNHYTNPSRVFGISAIQQAITALYIIQNEGSTFCRDSCRTNSQVSWIIERMRTKPSDAPIIPVENLLALVRSRGIEMNRLAEMKVPDTFIKSVHEYLEPADVPIAAPCIAPWCAYYGSTIGMTQLKRFNNKVLYKHERFPSPYVCTGCYLKYGIRAGNDDWTEIGDIVELGWAKVRPLLNKGHSLTESATSLGVPVHSVSRVAGYLMRHRLVANHVIEKYAPKEIPDQLVDKFRNVHSKRGSSVEMIAKKYGWTKLHYHYYVAGYDVRHYLYLDSDKPRHPRLHKGTAKGEWRKKVEDYLEMCVKLELEVSIRGVAKALNCSPILLHRYGLNKIINNARVKQQKSKAAELWKQVREYVRTRQEEEWLNPRGFYPYAGHGEKWLRRYHPEIVTWLSKQALCHKKKRSQQRYNELAQQVTEAVGQLFLEEMSISLQSVAKQLGVDNSVFHRTPALKEAFYEALATINQR
ncbi:TniQ family protein [Alicyclobacillus dauci]|uniref:TniQ family protein n=1 Tax=Alicyclobacillus dauci TaxID=1475485 RepID=A0ABY6Z3J7_9BACL|nr:TniQ family protein [Alicyclobacillus dauci]WAH37452.1 TniQ family protein [Alicyclobacillus dauci]